MCYRNNSFKLSKHKFLWPLPLLVIVFLPFINISNIFLLIVVIVGIIYFIYTFKNTINNKKIQLYMALFLCVYLPMLFSLPDAVNFAETSRKVLSFLLFIFMGVAIIHIYEKNKTKDLLLFGIGILLTFWTIDALFQFIIGQNILGYPYTGKQLRGIFYPDYRIGIVLAIFSAIYFEFLRRCQSIFILSWIMLFPYICVIALAGNRNSWFMLIISSFLYFLYFIHADFLKQIKLKSISYGVVIIGLVIISVYAAKPSLFNEAQTFIVSRLSSINYDLNDSKKINTLEHRVEIWETGLRIASVHWINGIGVRGFRYIDHQKYINNKQSFISERTSMSTHPHQITLEILVETGVIGVIGYILFWVILFKILLQTRSTNEGIQCWPWFISVIVSIFPLNMHKAFYGHFSSIIIWVLVALALAYLPVNENIRKVHNSN